MLKQIRTIGVLALLILFAGRAMSQTVISMPAPPKKSAPAVDQPATSDDGIPTPTATVSELDPLGVTAITRYAMARGGSDYQYGMDDRYGGRYIRNYGWPYVYSPAVFYGFPGFFGGHFGHGGFGHGGFGHGGFWCGPSWTIDITID